MTQKLSWLPGWMQGGAFARRTSDAQVEPTPMRAHVLSLVLRPIAPPLALGLVVAAFLIAAESLLVYVLMRAAPGNLFGVVFLLGVLVVSIGWGFRLGTMTALVSALVYAYFHSLQAGGSFIPTEPQNWVAITVFLIVALSATTLGGVARSRAVEADERRREVEAGHSELTVLAQQQAALRRVATRVARGASPSEVFEAVADELAECLDVVNAGLVRFEEDGTGYVVAVRYEPGIAEMPITGERIPLAGDDVASAVSRTGRAARIDNYENVTGSLAARVRAGGIASIVGVPIVVDSRLWGAAIVGSRGPEPMPPDTEARIADFADLVGKVIANAVTRAELQASRDELGVLAEQQAALRRVATLVARGASPSEVFAAVADELARCLHVVNAGLLRYEADGTGLVVAVQYEPGITKMPVTGERISLAGDDVGARVLHTGHAARIDNHENAPGPEAARIRAAGIGSIVGVPIVVNTRLWGAAVVGSRPPEPMPPDTEARIADFADLVATAIANAATGAELQASRDDLHALAAQQAALRRVATLVARGVSPSEVFSAVADEMAGCLHAQNASVNRYEGDTVTVLALSHLDSGMKHKPVVGERHTLEGDNIATRVLHNGRPARLDVSELDNAPGSIAARLREMGLRCTVAVPIVVDGRVWGMAAVGSSAPEPPGADTEARVGDFADLVATAIANAATRAELGVLGEQQAALRRVATLVARGVSPSEVFSSVAQELASCLAVPNAAIYRYETGDTATLLAARDEPGVRTVPIGTRFSFQGENVTAMVYRTGRSARMDSHENAAGPIAALTRELGIRSRVGAPIIVDEIVWGAAIVASSQPDPLPPDTESRIAAFADLVATAIANAATRAELIASRARIVAAADDGRRRLERDLHDGAQQRLVALGLQMRVAEESVPPELHGLKEQFRDIVSGLTAVSADLQEISRGIHPAILSKGGLAPALKVLARRSAVPVTLELAIDRRLPDSVEVGAYYVVSEGLANAAKHSRASQVAVRAQSGDDSLRLLIRDDGVGGADVGKGSGLVGLRDRVEALGGRIRIMSPAGSGTSLDATIPLDRP
jgi:GAF domain-containing protein